MPNAEALRPDPSEQIHAMSDDEIKFTGTCVWCGNPMQGSGWCSRRCQLEHQKADPADFAERKRAKKAEGCGQGCGCLIFLLLIVWGFFYLVSKGN